MEATDSHETRAKDTLLPNVPETQHAPTHARARSDAGTLAHAQAQADARALIADASKDAPDTPTKKRAFSLPQSPAPPVSLFRPANMSSVLSTSSETTSVRDLASPPTPLIFPVSPPLHGPTPNELYPFLMIMCRNFGF